MSTAASQQPRIKTSGTNHAYGLTTLLNQHVKANGDKLTFRFRGKHGIEHEIEVADPRMAKVVPGCLNLPGQDLFAYVDADGAT